MDKCECCGTSHDPLKTDCKEESYDIEPEAFDHVDAAIEAGGHPLNI